MIPQEILERADDYYTVNINTHSGINLNKRGRNAIPNGYKILEKYADSFEIDSDNIVRPVYNEVYHGEIPDGHSKGQGPNEQTFDLEMSIIAEGELHLNESRTEVVGGDMTITINLYIT